MIIELQQRLQTIQEETLDLKSSLGANVSQISQGGSYYTGPKKCHILGLPWLPSGYESTMQYGDCGFDPLLGIRSYMLREQLSLHCS